MTLVYEFDYLADEITEDRVNILARNFFEDPTSFVHPLEIDEVLIVAVEDITED